MTLSKFLIPSLCSIALLAVPCRAAYLWRDTTDPNQKHLYKDGVLVGGWILGEGYHRYNPSTGKLSSEACPYPWDEPEVPNYGVTREAPSRERWVVNGREVSKEDALKALKGDSPLPDDSQVPYLVWVGDAQKGQQIQKDLASDPYLKTKPFRFQSYAPTDFGACDRDGKACYPPGLWCVGPDRKVLWKLPDYPGAETLAGYLRKLDPAYDPSKVPDLSEEALQSDYTVPVTSLGVLSLLGSLLLFRKPK